MQTTIHQRFSTSPQRAELEQILRSCVHCGFCTATCPTYQLLGDELDSPRGRIYLIKNYLESGSASDITRVHLDRCLSCCSCETTCPSGVRYTRLLDITKTLLESELPRAWWQRMLRAAIAVTIPYPARMTALLKVAGLFRPLLAEAWRRKIPLLDPVSVDAVVENHVDANIDANVDAAQPAQRSVIVFEGCVQSVVAQSTNNALRVILQKLSIQPRVVTQAGCCSALCHHLSDEQSSQQQIKHNIDAWWPHIEAAQDPVEAIVISASGCAKHIREYGELMKGDANYAEKAAAISRLAQDASTFVTRSLEQMQETNSSEAPKFIHHGESVPVAFHSPCSLQHGLGVNGVVEKLLQQAGYRLCQVEDAHICCGSAGSYSLLQSKLSQALLSNKIRNLQQEKPRLIATANIGCQLHLQSASATPVCHWLELIAQRLQ